MQSLLNVTTVLSVVADRDGAVFACGARTSAWSIR